MRGLSVILAVAVHSLNRSKDDIIAYVLPLAIRLAKGKKLPLGTLYLESLYTRLDECVDNILCSVGLYDVVTYADTSSLHIFLWKGFNSIARRPSEFEDVTFKELMVRGGKKRKKSHPYMPKAWWWAEVNQATNKSLLSFLSDLIDVEEEFTFRL